MTTAFSTISWLMMKSFKFSMANAARKTAQYIVKVAVEVEIGNTYDKDKSKLKEKTK